MRMEVFLDGNGWLKLDKLIEVNFSNCKNCEEIPMFGHLPLLKYLTLDGLTNVRSICPSFYGGQETRVMFPALKRLIPKNMPNLTEWAEAEVMPVAEKRTCREQVAKDARELLPYKIDDSAMSLWHDNLKLHCPTLGEKGCRYYNKLC
ncbi:unnamed protein product [Fraxinus pennsylvanica]|uniref:Uncharacterized protein n=1 Tax=Fraxinus pennsylvanica TaxID=56036 RepID=A0AAD2DSG3_9LAMI|nr:unnamed protein product [Fraxinus pennsylvanica]